MAKDMSSRHILQDMSLHLEDAFMSSYYCNMLRHIFATQRTCLKLSFFWMLWKTCLWKTFRSKGLGMWVCSLVVTADTVAEWLRRLTRNQLDLFRVGSSPTGVAWPFFCNYFLQLFLWSQKSLAKAVLLHTCITMHHTSWRKFTLSDTPTRHKLMF